jgi:hypothetical protein
MFDKLEFIFPLTSRTWGVLLFSRTRFIDTKTNLGGSGTAAGNQINVVLQFYSLPRPYRG